MRRYTDKSKGLPLKDMGVEKQFRRYFFRGLAVLLPTIITIWILAAAYRFIQSNISIYINRAIVAILARTDFFSNYWSKEDLTKFWVNGAGSIAGFIIALLAVFIIGAILASVVGRGLWKVIENFIMNTPVLKRVFPYVKQVTDFLLTQEEQEQVFSKVVAVEYPRKGVWSVGFVTGSGLKKIVDSVEKEFLTVLVPNSPTPLTGYVVMVPREQTIALDMTVEEAFRFTISAGVITPGGKVRAELPDGDLESKDER